MAKTPRQYVYLQVEAKFSTNQVEVRGLLNSLAEACATNSELEEEGSPQKKDQLAMMSILLEAANKIKEANKKNWGA
jgi:hypothetical protein